MTLNLSNDYKRAPIKITRDFEVAKSRNEVTHLTFVYPSPNKIYVDALKKQIELIDKALEKSYEIDPELK